MTTYVNIRATVGVEGGDGTWMASDKYNDLCTGGRQPQYVHIFHLTRRDRGLCNCPLPIEM